MTDHLPPHVLLGTWIEESGVSRRQVAKAAQVDPAHLSRVLSGAKPASPALILRLAEALGKRPTESHALRTAIISDAASRSPALSAELLANLSGATVATALEALRSASKTPGSQP